MKDLEVTEYTKSLQFISYKRLTQLLIRNSHGGLIWQTYTIKNELEKRLLEHTAKANGFYHFELFCPVSEKELLKETWPDWREQDCWKQRYTRFLETGHD